MDATGSNLQTGAKQDGSTTVATGTGVAQVTSPLSTTAANTIVATFGNGAAGDLQTANQNTRHKQTKWCWLPCLCLRWTLQKLF